jgi:hypothetical protein
MKKPILVVILLLITGCGGTDRPPLAPVSGVLLNGDKPVADATVTFNMEGKEMPRVGMGKTDSEGKFYITTYDTRDGAYIGTHVVTISKIAASDVVGGGEMEIGSEAYGKAMEAAATNTAPPKQEIPDRYTKVETSPLKITVEAGGKSDVKLIMD